MLGQPNVDVMLARMPLNIFLEWQQYFALEPFGPLQDYFRSGQELAWNAMFHGCQKGQKKPFQPDDFYPHLSGKTEEEKTEADLVAELDQMFGIG